MPVDHRLLSRKAPIGLLAVLLVTTAGALIAHKVVAIACLAVALVAFGALLYMEVKRPSLSRRLILGCTAGLLVVAVITPPRISQDVWSYSIYGEIVAHYGANPYKVAPSAFAADPLFRYVSHYWVNARSVYGPVFTVISAAGLLAAHRSPLAARLFFQLLAAASVAIALWLLHREKADPRTLFALGLNPFVVVSVVNGGHNDALCGLAVLGAVLLVTRKKFFWAGLALAAGALIKITVLLLVVAIAIWLLRNRKLKEAVTTVAASASATGLGYLLAGGVSAFKPLGRASGTVSYISMWNIATRLSQVPVLSRVLGVTRNSGVEMKEVASTWGLAVTVVFALLLIFIYAREPTPTHAIAGAVFAYLLVATYVEPWYLMWALPVIVINWKWRVSLGAFAYSSVLLLLQIPLRYWSKTAMPVHKILSASLPAVQICTLMVLVVFALRRVALNPDSRAQGGI